MEYDLDALAAFLDAYPNALADTSARVPDLQQKPKDHVRAFFLKYRERILYGTDWEVDATTFSTDPAERDRAIAKRVAAFTSFSRYFEETLGLPEEVLMRFYFTNAKDLFRLPTTPE